MIAVPDSAKRERECPFAGVAVPVKDPVTGGMALAMQRAACGPNCALYDRQGRRPCFERLIESIGALTEALKAAPTRA